MKITLIYTLLILSIQLSFSQDETDEWKLFSCNENNFSIKFPEFCTEIKTRGPISESRKEVIKEKGTLRFSFDVMKYFVTFSTHVVPIYSLTIYNNPDKLKLEYFIYKVIIDNMNIYQKSDIIIESYDFEKFDSFIANYKNKVGGYTGIKSELFIKREDQIFRLDLLRNWNNQYDELFYKIIETLKIEE